jgi:hypothetical protein
MASTTYVLTLFCLINTFVFPSYARGQQNINERVLFALSHTKPMHSGPNCYNSALFSLGIAQGLHFDLFDLWMSSPICQRIDGKPHVNDLIHIQVQHEGTKVLESAHLYQYLGDGLAFNKANMENSSTYEITSIKKGQAEYNISSDCSFVSQSKAYALKCRAFSEVYRCNANGYISHRQKSTDPIIADLTKLAEIATQATISGTTANFKDLALKSSMVGNYALEKLGIPQAYRKFGQQLSSHVLNSINHGFPLTMIENGKETKVEISKDQLYETFAWIYIRANPIMKIDFYSSAEQKAIKIFRDKKVYSSLSDVDTLLWSGTYTSSLNLRDQFDWLSLLPP